MREINSCYITEKVEQMCIEANCNLNCDILNAVKNSASDETNSIAKNILNSMLENARIASDKQIPICQDTGMAIFFIEVGQDIHINGNLTEAINLGVKNGYKKGYLRKSVVADPVRRGNTGDNTPAVIHYDIVPGDKLKIIFLPKGFGSENMSRLKMLKPSDGAEGVIDFVVETVKLAGSNPCPPVVVGVGIGGSMEKAAMLSKLALARPVNSSNNDEYYSDMEKEILDKINETGIGPQGLGGKTTALGVNIETFPTHIAGLPVAVNISCHVTRHSQIII